ncbi:hypothetical protein BC830DRAFT_1115993 [Chytriomyces sp. MP71]|nr:hypothetical protein BC830DRAFT_1115993 [Chytriomyces sp. MP71]
MATDTVAQVILETPPLTGIFDNDYNETCRHLQLGPFEWPRVRRIGHPLPPLPEPRTTEPPTSLSSYDSISNDSMLSIAATDKEIAATADTVGENKGSSAILGPVSQSENARIASISPAVSAANLALPPTHGSVKETTAKYVSRYRFQPTLCVETREADDEEEVYKVEVRGWKLSAKVLDIVSTVLTSCPSVTHLVLWNCNLTELHFPALLGAVLTANIKTLTLDQNPGIPETMYAYLISDDSLVKHLSLRMNKITCVGAKALASALKINRIIVSLNLWCNSIGREGTGELAEALKFNQTLSSFSLAKNPIGDDGVAALAKMLGNFPLHPEDLLARKKATADLERLRREQEDDPIIKKAKSRFGNGLGRNQSGKKSEDNLSKTQTTLDAKQKKGAAGAPPATAGATPGATGKGVPGKAGAVPAPAAAAKKTPEALPAAATGKKGAPAAAAAPTAGGKGGGADKKGAAPAPGAPTAKGAAGKKGAKVEEAKEEAEENNELSSFTEPVFEHNGQLHLIGNRTLNNMNLRQCMLTESSLKSLADALSEQDLSVEGNPEGVMGLIRVALMVSFPSISKAPDLVKTGQFVRQGLSYAHSAASFTECKESFSGTDRQGEGGRRRGGQVQRRRVSETLLI